MNIKINNFQKVPLFTHLSRILMKTLHGEYCCVEKSVKLFDKISNQRDSLKIINLYFLISTFNCIQTVIRVSVFSVFSKKIISDTEKIMQPVVTNQGIVTTGQPNRLELTQNLQQPWTTLESDGYPSFIYSWSISHSLEHEFFYLVRLGSLGQ